ncbi:Ger(x)C family spore germination protein [Virgibacillus sp. 6R]|uniref:Ger(x)C family spore germination protein n=1 Tax=Metabacillus sp. 22489 TaxID=3453928 RepID=UPI0011A02F8D
MRFSVYQFRRSIFITIIALSLVLQFGCGFKDIDKRIFVLSIGIDHSDNDEKPYKITLKLAVPSGSIKETGAKYTYLTKESESIASAVRLLKSHVDKELDFGHAKVIVFGEEILNHDMNEVIDFFVRRRDIQKISWVAVGNPSAESVLKTEPSSEKAGSHALFNFFDENGVESAYIVSTYLFDFQRRLSEKGYDPILPVFNSSEDKKKIVVNSSSLLANKKEPLNLSPEETKLYNVMANNVEKLNLTIKRDDLLFTVSIDSSKTKFKLDTAAKQKPVLKMDVTMKGVMEEANQPMNPKKLSTYSHYASKEVEKQLTELLTMLQENDADPIGFGLRYQASKLHTEKTYKEWRQIYPELSFDVHVKVSIMSTGIVE